ncbi:hypothetical protein F0P96_17145 [Hymenobacter busanensis]|uniref:Uncharacterized protein n=1 Tax=Hymenobacter busanensis TaxID=2607656 RepID=A0A7L4ZRW2_9BACT|nr:hypothetical protein [Hymenobacter busanensis]KAA9327701.1 hypothetical protein F0P96_17145 [Hymenobacter busanensis]QHJ05959.1 hypothetical protein GUY19_01085 [Hymenobacter busanensis]
MRKLFSFFFLLGALGAPRFSAQAQSAPGLAEQLRASSEGPLKAMLTNGKVTPDDVTLLLQTLTMNTAQGTAGLNLDNPATLNGLVGQLNRTLQSSQGKSYEQSAGQLITQLLTVVPPDVQTQLLASPELLRLQLNGGLTDLGALALGAEAVLSTVNDFISYAKQRKEVDALTPRISKFVSADGTYHALRKQVLVEEFDEPSKQWRQFRNTRQWLRTDLPAEPSSNADPEMLLRYIPRASNGPQRQAWAGASFAPGTYVLADSVAPEAHKVSGLDGFYDSFWPVVSQSRAFANTSGFDFTKDFSLKLRLKALAPRQRINSMGMDEDYYSLRVKLFGVNTLRLDLRKRTQLKSQKTWYYTFVYADEAYQTGETFGVFAPVRGSGVWYGMQADHPGPKFDSEWVDVEITKTGTQLQYALNGAPVVQKNGKPVVQEIGPVLNRYQLDLHPSGRLAIDRVELRHL